jgi:hypothetical protein
MGASYSEMQTALVSPTSLNELFNLTIESIPVIQQTDLIKELFKIFVNVISEKVNNVAIFEGQEDKFKTIIDLQKVIDNIETQLEKKFNIPKFKEVITILDQTTIDGTDDIPKDTMLEIVDSGSSDLRVGEKITKAAFDVEYAKAQVKPIAKGLISKKVLQKTKRVQPIPMPVYGAVVAKYIVTDQGDTALTKGESYELDEILAENLMLPKGSRQAKYEEQSGFVQRDYSRFISQQNVIKQEVITRKDVEPAEEFDYDIEEPNIDVEEEDVENMLVEEEPEEQLDEEPEEL